jgi:hypothetical protein
MKLHIGMGLEPMLVLLVGVKVVEDNVKLAFRKSRGARELLGMATPAAEAAVEIDPAAAQPLAQPCPCCGGRMFVIETFDAGCQPRCRPTAMRIDTS